WLRLSCGLCRVPLLCKRSRVAGWCEFPLLCDVRFLGSRRRGGLLLRGGFAWLRRHLWFLGEGRRHRRLLPRGGRLTRRGGLTRGGGLRCPGGFLRRGGGGRLSFPAPFAPGWVKRGWVWRGPARGRCWLRG